MTQPANTVVIVLSPPTQSTDANNVVIDEFTETFIDPTSNNTLLVVDLVNKQGQLL